MKQSAQNNVKEIKNPQINNSHWAGVHSLDQKYPNCLYYSAQSWVSTCFHECSCLCSGCWCTRCSGDTVEVLCFGAPAHRSSTPGQKDTSGKPAWNQPETCYWGSSRWWDCTWWSSLQATALTGKPAGCTSTCSDACWDPSRWSRHDTAASRGRR